MRLGSRKQRKPFSPPAPALHRANPDWATPAPWALLLCWGSPVPEANPHGFSFVGKQDWAREAFCAQAPAMPPEPARPPSAKAPSHQRPQTIYWQLHSAKGNSTRAANHSPNAPRIEKATQAVFPSGTPHTIGRTGAGLPRLPGPCCFAGGLGCPKPTPHGFSFVGKQDWAREDLLRPGTNHAH